MWSLYGHNVILNKCNSNTGCPKKVSMFDQQWNRGLLFKIRIFSALQKTYANLDFEIKIVEIQ